jgi:hypothetical protein
MLPLQLPLVKAAAVFLDLPVKNENMTNPTRAVAGGP